MRAPDPVSVAAAADRAEARSRGEPPRGRGRLSSIDLLPPEAEEDKIWALGELAKRERTQAEILINLNDRLARKGVDAISSSAFNRHAMRKIRTASRMQEGRDLFAGMSKQFTAENVDEQTVVLGEFMKTLILELMIDREGEATPKDAMELARAYQSVVSAQKMSSERRAKLEREFAAKTEAAIEKVTAAIGLSADRAKQLRRDLLGVRLKDEAST